MVNAQRIGLLIESEDQKIRKRAQQLATRLQLPIIELRDQVDFDLLLVQGVEKLELREPKSRSGSGLLVDFETLNPRSAARRGGFSKNQPLARAMGRDAKRVLDATAGLGHDAALLACIGFQVTAAERSAIIAALLEDGFQRAMQNPDLRERLEGRLQIVNADARDLLQHPSAQFDAVYMDPMFPPKRKASALAKKSIRMVRALVGDDDDAAQLLQTARSVVRRVIVKRPTYAPALHSNPTATIESKLVRYDIYINMQQALSG